VTRLQSGAFGYFFVIAQVMAADGSRATFDKAGMWSAEDERINVGGLRAEKWRDLSDDERRAVLAYLHETTHHVDITSLPAGTFYWRIWDAIRQYGELYIDFLRELDLAAQVQGPLTTWLRTEEAKSVVAERLSKREWFGKCYLDPAGRVAVQRDYCGSMLDNIDSLHRVAKELLRDSMPKFGLYEADLNLTAMEIHARFLVDSPPLFEATDYERVPRQQWVKGRGALPDDLDRYFMSLVDILELRAYSYELQVLQQLGDRAFRADVLDRATEALSPNASAVLRSWNDKDYAPFHLRYITDIALSGAIDPNCCYHHFAESPDPDQEGYDSRPTVKVDFQRNWPSYRMAALLSLLADDWTILTDPDRATARFYTEVGQYLFGAETYPFTGMSMTQRSMIPRRFRGPMESPLPKGRTWDPELPSPLTDMLVGNPRAEWKPEIYLEELNQVFTHNQQAYLQSFTKQGEHPGFVEPRTYILKDCVIGAERTPFSGDGSLPKRARRIATMSLLRHYIGAIFATSLLEGQPVRIHLSELVGRWGDADWLRDVREKLRDVYGQPMVERFFS
jgi:hypothetical protein